MIARPEVLAEYVVTMSNMTVIGHNLNALDQLKMLQPQGLLVYTDRAQVIGLLSLGLVGS